MNYDTEHLRVMVLYRVGLAGVLSAAVLCAIVGCRGGEEEASTDPATQPAKGEVMPAQGEVMPAQGETMPAKGEIMLTICYDNNRGQENLTPAWGFACVVGGLQKTILFDTGGDGQVLLANMEALGIKPAEIDVVVLSHVHDDHTGGLREFLRARGGVPVYMPTGFPAALGQKVERLGGEPIIAEGPTTICDGARTTGTMGQGQIEEHGLCVKTSNGWVLITGCAHPGIAEMAERATQLVDSPLRLVVGGFHMGGASKRQIEAVINRFDELGVATVAPCHCSGEAMRRLCEEHYGESYIPACVGTCLQFPPEDSREEVLRRDL